MSSALHVVLLFPALWTLSSCVTRQFHVVKEEKNWTEAQKNCRENFTDLAAIESQEEMDAVKAVLNSSGGHFWIGLSLRDPKDKTSWVWSDNSTSSYRDWNKDTSEPNDPGRENCVDIWNDKEYKWFDDVCHLLRPFVCYKAIPLILIKQNKTWREALRYCRENHVDLVSVHDQEIQRWVEAAVNYASTAIVWMGLRHTCTLSFWFWVSGSTTCYQNWAPGNGTGEKDCSEVERTGAIQSGSKQWVSLPETQTLYFICTTSEDRTETIYLSKIKY